MQQKFHNGGRTYGTRGDHFRRGIQRDLRRNEILAAMVRGDHIDARAMLAREVAAERVWRIDCGRQTPADCVRRELETGEPLRLTIERDCGETLA